MLKRGRVAFAVSAAALGLAFAGSASAAGFYLQEQSVRGLGRAYSGEAADTGADSLWWNPAAIGEVQGAEVYAGAHVILSDTKLSDNGSIIVRPLQAPAPVGGDPVADNPLKVGVVPNFDAAWRVNEHVAVGLGVSAPFDFITKYDSTSFARYEALTSRLVDLDLQPTLAIHVNRYVDLGVGADAQYTVARLSTALPNLSPLLPDGSNSLRGDGWNYGWTVGAQFHPTDRFSVGVSYRSQIDHTLNGTATVQGLLGPLAGNNGALGASAKFSTPWIVVLGARYVLDEHWTLNAQVQEVGWSVFNDIDIRTLLGPSAIPQNYHNTTTGAVGVDYAVNPKVTLRAGVAYDPTPTPNSSRSANVPDGDRVLLTIGTTVRPAPKVELEAAFGYIDLMRDKVNAPTEAYVGTPVATPVLYNATMSGSAYILSTGVKFKF